MFSLENLAADDTTVVKLKNPETKKELPGLVVTVHNQDSPQWTKFEERFTDHKQKQKVLIGRDGENNAVEVDASAAETRRKIIIACIQNIEGIKDFKFSTAAAQKLFADSRYNWIYMQIDSALTSRNYDFLNQKDAA